MKYLLAFSFIFLLVFSCRAQDYEYGKPTELKGLTRVFIDAGANVKGRESIVKELEKAKIKDLKILDSARDADIILMFSGKTEAKPIRDKYYDYQTGKGLVVISNSAKQMNRLVYSFESTKDGIGEKSPAVKFAREFIKTYKSNN